MNGAAREYIGRVSLDPYIVANYETFAFSILRNSLINFIRTLLQELGLGLKIYYDVNCIFTRTVSENVDEYVFVPFRQASVVYSVNDLSFIQSHVDASISVFVEKCELFTSQGSGWSLSSIVSISVFVAVLQHQLGQIGARRDISRRNLFGNNAVHHDSSDGQLILCNILWSSCDDSNFCFPLAVGAASYRWSELKKVSTMKKNEAIQFKQNMIESAYSLYDFTMIENYPVNMNDLQRFIKTNSSKVLINIMGLSQKSGKNGRKKIRVWPLLRSELLGKCSSLPVIHLVIVKEISAQDPRYHMAFCRDIQKLLARAQLADYRSAAQTYCILCFQGVPTEYYDKHIVLCSSQSESLTVQCYKPPGQKLTFNYGLRRTPPVLYGAFDIECATRPSDKSFGPMTKVLGEFIPVSFSFQTVFSFSPIEDLAKGMETMVFVDFI